MAHIGVPTLQYVTQSVECRCMRFVQHIMRANAGSADPWRHRCKAWRPPLGANSYCHVYKLVCVNMQP